MLMPKFSIEEICKKIQNEETFELLTDLDEGFALKIEEYVPYVCFSTHSGSKIRKEAKKNIAISQRKRKYQEDPHTEDFVVSMPIMAQGLDSRYEYDLNRSPENAIYEEAFGYKVWKKALTEAEKKKALQKHQNFYTVISVLLQKLESKFQACVVYDIHAFNYKKIERETPMFNIGTEKIDNRKFGNFVKSWQKELEKIQLPEIESTVKINDVFHGRGYLLEYITKNFSNTLVLATEIKKVYCNEEKGDFFPVVIDAITQGLKKAILNHALEFIQKKTTLKVANINGLLSSTLEPQLLQIDERIYELASEFEILSYVNPVNIEQEKKRFFANNCTQNPKFQYSYISVNPFELKRKFYRVPVELIDDIHLQNMYKDVIDSYADKVDMLSGLGTEKFFYNSLRYFGSPNEQDVKNALFLINSPNMLDEFDAENIPAEQAIDIFAKSAEVYGFPFKIELSNKMTSKALVNNGKKTLFLKKGAMFSKRNSQALVHHEIGVHMLTTLNAREQPIKLFRLGLPLNTLTQEGLAILSEYLSGNITITRLQELGLRVLLVNMRTRGYEFKDAYRMLVEEYNQKSENAYYLATRIYRGGGFTKDYLYLRGFRDLLNYWKSGKSLENLLVGKTSLGYIDTINEMVARGMINPPKYKTIPFLNPTTDNQILNYLVNGLK